MPFYKNLYIIIITFLLLNAWIYIQKPCWVWHVLLYTSMLVDVQTSLSFFRLCILHRKCLDKYWIWHLRRGKMALVVSLSKPKLTLLLWNILYWNNSLSLSKNKNLHCLSTNLPCKIKTGLGFKTRWWFIKWIVSI